MKNENLVILVAFIIGIIVIFQISNNKKDRGELTQKSSNTQTVKLAQNQQNPDLVEQLTRENESLKNRITELENMNTQYIKMLGNIQKRETNSENALPNHLITSKDLGPFGSYQEYIPCIKELINYAKSHKIPVTEREELKKVIDLCGGGQKVKGINSTQRNMSVIYMGNGYYIKLLQNLVAIYGPYPYHLDFALDGKATCVGKSERGYSICQQLGGKEDKANSPLPSWIPYHLPKNIFDN